MIPLQLTLKNFLSYRSAALDFRSFHTACVCGANGAGKSSLLEAITWVLWGQSRAATDDDVILMGAKDVRVDFTFISNNQTYRVIRSRAVGKSVALDFQVETNKGNFRSITAKSVRATQEQITFYLKLDYDTFVNSAYLRQGRADEFMMRRPSERKQVLADLLKLDRYEELSEKAKEVGKELKGKIEQLQSNLEPLENELKRRGEIGEEAGELEGQLKQLEGQQKQDEGALQALQDKQRDRANWEQQVRWQQERCEQLQRECDRAQQDRDRVRQRLNELQQLCDREVEITAGYQELLQLQQQEEVLSAKFQTYQDSQQQKQQIEQQLTQKLNDLNLEIRQFQTRIETLEQQQQELQETLRRAPEISAALVQLQQHRQRLQELDRLQLEVSPLSQRRNTLLVEIDRARAKLSARVEQLQVRVSEFARIIDDIPHQRKKLLDIVAKVEALKKKKVYRDRVNEKGQESNKEIARLQENENTYTQQIAELETKLTLLKTPEALCPLCERPLDAHHHQQVVEKTRSQQDVLNERIWQLRQQIVAYEAEVKNLRLEYKQLTDELVPHESLSQQQGQLASELDRAFEMQEQMEEIKAELAELENAIAAGNFALEAQTELQNLDRQLQTLHYNEETHALVRGEEKRWRWAEVKQANLEDAKRKQEQIDIQKPQLQAQLQQLRDAVEQLRLNSPLQRQLQEVEDAIAQLGYDRTQHQQLIAAARQAQSWQLPYQNLQRARGEIPEQQARLTATEQQLQARQSETATMREHLASLTAQMTQIADYSAEIASLEGKVQQGRRERDDAIARRGRVQQQLAQIERFQTQYEESTEELQSLRRKSRVYQELARAFGKNGIQALTIENILPNLEAQTNQILARLTGNQLHVQFITQKASKSASKRKAKTIDTLEILIADARGTRPYETYSGGEAFRINFSIRLALARLLAQSAGTSLQMLIIDEGFGTQDREGCDRLIAAINAIASDFSCILTVTHMPQFKEAFQTRIEVHKTEAGSQLQLLN
ncbi:exonuclease subunit SbcC [Oscillatoria sp. FACHB-1406]|uniref:exonuclease subunit SbcC n=1 Tax=Oscillatoria sp. FACHB-1406 TaxID=2692846 RepID=UPI00168259E0|nr:exonuclease subunit SbcC [Oscillatoria sp. FACHB-1406]MBD2579879.1 exonuclease subunit SbcC [Oscillatoria sp. FACHB-1406]